MYKQTALLLLISGQAFAAPTIFPTSVTTLSSISNPTTSNIVADSVDSKHIYVMPPSVAISKIGGLHTLSANLGFCREMADDKDYSAALSKKIKDLVIQETDAKKDADVVRQKLFTAKEEAAQFTTQARLQDLADLDSNIAANESRLSDLYNQANSCKTACDEINQEIDDLVKNKAELLKNRRAMAQTHAADMRTYERYQAQVQALQENLDDLTSSWQKISNRVKQVRNDFLDMYSTFAKMEGARASISFKSDWNQNVANLKANNPGIEFEKIPTQNAQVLSSLTIENLPGAEAVLAYEVGGQNVNGVLKLSSYPESMSGNVVLSLVGACPVLHKDWYDISDTQSTSADQMKYGLTISYEYPTTFTVSAVAHYNMYKMYQKIVSSGSSGGFFSSRSWSNVEERNMFKDSFSVKWDEQDPSFSLSDEQKADVEAEMRKGIFDRMASLVIPQSPDRNGIIQAVGAPKHGSLVIADSLMKTCPGNAYCIGASIAMNVLDAIFGSSSTTASYLQTYNADLTESYSRSKVIYKPAITSYQ